MKTVYLSGKMTGLEERYNKQKEINKELVEENESLKAQIEKMKCCFNCRHSRTEYEHCRTDKHKKWELKEDD